MRSYPLMIKDVEFRCHGIVGIYELRNKIAFIHFAFGAVSIEEHNNDKRTPSYAILDVFSSDFSKHEQAHLFYREQEIFSNHDAVCYWENDRFLLNTKRYIGFGPSIAKTIEIRDTEMLEVGDAPEPVEQIYNDSKTYSFGGFTIHMASRFIMECQSDISGETLWKLRLSAYLYTEIENRNGILYFGTAGNGGRFYAVSLTDGTVVFSYNTGGTVRFEWYNDNVLLADRKNKPVLLNTKDGSEVHPIDFGKYQLTSYQYMMIKDSRLYAVASGTDAMHAVCVDL